MTPPERLDLLEFPCDFAVKAFGQGGENFDLTVVAIVRRHAPHFGEDAVSVRSSRGGRYQAVTVTIRATSQAQLDAIYRELGTCESVLMTL